MSKQSSLALSIGSAIGSAFLLFASQVAIEEYKSRKQIRISAAEAEIAQKATRQKLLDDMVTKFDELGEVPTRAGEFVETGRGGSKDDVLAVAQHFRILNRYIANKRIGSSEAASYYGGPVSYWNTAFQSLADESSPAARYFSFREREGFGLLANALSRLDREIELAAEDEFIKLNNQIRPKMSRPPRR